MSDKETVIFVPVMLQDEKKVQELSRLCHFIRNESSRNVVFISISGRFA